MFRRSRSEVRTSIRSRPTAKRVAYTSNIDEVQATSTNSDIFIVPIAGGTPKKITTNPGSDSTPLYSPDGKYIAYRAQLRGGYESDRFRLMLYERATGKITDVDAELRSLGGFDDVVARLEDHLLHRRE